MQHAALILEESMLLTRGVFLWQDLLALLLLHVEVGRHLAGDGVGREALVLDAVVQVAVDALHPARERRGAGLKYVPGFRVK